MNDLNKKCEENLEQVYGVIKNMKKVQITHIPEVQGGQRARQDDSRRERKARPGHVPGVGACEGGAVMCDMTQAKERGNGLTVYPNRDFQDQNPEGDF